MIREAFAHLPADRAAGAMAMAQLEPMARMLTAITVTAYDAGLQNGVRQGRLELEREMEDDWRPVSERIRQSAGAPSKADRERYEREAVIQTNAVYTGGPVESW